MTKTWDLSRIFFSCLIIIIHLSQCYQILTTGNHSIRMYPRVTLNFLYSCLYLYYHAWFMWCWGIKPSALCMLGRCSTTWATSPISNIDVTGKYLFKKKKKKTPKPKQSQVIPDWNFQEEGKDLQRTIKETRNKIHLFWGLSKLATLITWCLRVNISKAGA